MFGRRGTFLAEAAGLLETSFVVNTFRGVMLVVGQRPGGVLLRIDSEGWGRKNGEVEV